MPMVSVVRGTTWTKGAPRWGKDRMVGRRVRELVRIKRVGLRLVMVRRMVVGVGWGAISSAAGIALGDLVIGARGEAGPKRSAGKIDEPY